MAQMPEEGRKFGIVDSYWKDIMSEAVRTNIHFNGYSVDFHSQTQSLVQITSLAGLKEGRSLLL